MNLQYKHLLPQDFSPSSRVWVYQSSRRFSIAEALELEIQLSKFSEEWRSHGADVKAYANLFFGQFIVLLADETKSSVSGCSTDSSVRFIKELGEKYAIDFFNRTSLAFFIKDQIQLLPLSQLEYAIENNFIDQETLYFNNLVATKSEMEEQWIIPLKNSWLASRLPVNSSAGR